MSRLLDEVPGIGKLIASVIAAVYRRGRVQIGRDFAAWLGITPRQNSSGASRRSEPSPRGQPIHKETARLGGDLAAAVVGKRQRRPARLDCRAAGEEPARLVTVALANNCPIIWAMMKTGEASAPKCRKA